MYTRFAPHPPILTRILLLVIPLSLTAFGTMGMAAEGTLAPGGTATPTPWVRGTESVSPTPSVTPYILPTLDPSTHATISVQATEDAYRATQEAALATPTPPPPVTPEMLGTPTPYGTPAEPVVATPTLAQEPWSPQPKHTAPFWEVSYWNNPSLSGEAVMRGTDVNLDHDWGTGSPHSTVSVDRFSARWTRYIDVAAGTYRFTATSDDGIRVIVDGRSIIDQWTDHPAQTFTGDVDLTAGHHLVTVEYYENTGYAVARVSWAAVPVAPHDWRGEYFANRWLGGVPVLVRDDAKIDFDWGYGSPAAGIPGDGFSVRWTRNVYLEPGSYRFTTTTDDGVRLWVNHHLLIDRWQDQPLRSHTGTIHLAGDVPIKMEYYENGGMAAARLTWTRVGGGPPPPPPPGVVLVDDTDPGFVKNGSVTGWRTAAEGYGGHLTWTRNNDRARTNYNWARWYPDLAPGRYEVFVYIPERYTTTSGARYWVSHRDGYAVRPVDQSANGDRWVPLGTYWFRGTRDDSVSLADVTHERYVSRLIAFDAVKWVPR
jgi:hypothetical protein